MKGPCSLQNMCVTIVQHQTAFTTHFPRGIWLKARKGFKKLDYSEENLKKSTTSNYESLKSNQDAVDAVD